MTFEDKEIHALRFATYELINQARALAESVREPHHDHLKAQLIAAADAADEAMTTDRGRG
jgi:hypothetical protein